MKVELKNDGGLVRKVPVGLSWTGFFFTGFTMMARGMIGKGLLYLLIVWFIQGIMLLCKGLIYVAEGPEAAAAAGVGYNLILGIPNFIFLFKLNKWTTRHWLDHGYKPIGTGWSFWGPKVGIQVSDEQMTTDANLTPPAKVGVKDILGFITAGIIVLVLSSSGAKTSSRGERTASTPEVLEPPKTQSTSKATATTETAAVQPENSSFIGHWRSVEKTSLGDKYFYTAFTPTHFTDMGDMVPYKVTQTKAGEITFTWVQETFSGDRFDRTSYIKILPNGHIRFRKGQLSDYTEFEKIPKDQWVEESGLVTDSQTEEAGN